MAQHTPYCRSERWIMVCTITALVLLVGAFFHPIWYTRMEAPQYPERDVFVEVYPGYLSGDMKEVELLSQYIGVHMPRNMPELYAVPWLMGAILVALGASLWTHRGRLRTWLMGSSTAAFLFLFIGGAATLQYRLYLMGHNRDPNPPLVGFEDFTPPFLGSIEVGNFNSTQMIGLGGWMLIMAFLLTVASLVVDWTLSPRPETVSDVRTETSPTPSNEETSEEPEPSGTRGEVTTQ